MNYSDVKLIGLVKHCPTVYDSKIAEFKIPHRKDEAWSQIANELQITVLECRNRWRTIRERYARELRRHSGNSTWPYFHLMEFLTAYIKPRDISVKLSTSKIKNEFDIKRKSDHDSLLKSEATTGHRLSGNDCDAGKYWKIDDSTIEINLNGLSLQAAATTTSNFVEIEDVYYDEQSGDQSNESAECDTKRFKRKYSCDEDLPNKNYQSSQSVEDKLFCSSIACTLNKLSRVHNIKAKCEIYKVLEKYIELEER